MTDGIKSPVRPWIKLWRSLAHEPDFLALSHTARSLYLLLLCLTDDRGCVATDRRSYTAVDISRLLRDDIQLVEAALLELEKVKFISGNNILNDAIHIVNFDAEQATIGKEEVREYWRLAKEKKQPIDSEGNGNANANGYGERRRRSNGDGYVESSEKIPRNSRKVPRKFREDTKDTKTTAAAAKNPLKVLFDITSEKSIPEIELSKINYALEALEPHFPGDELKVYLQPFWDWWRLEKKFSANNYAWLYDLAIAGEIPHELEEPEHDGA